MKHHWIAEQWVKYHYMSTVSEVHHALTIVLNVRHQAIDKIRDKVICQPLRAKRLNEQKVQEHLTQAS